MPKPKPDDEVTDLEQNLEQDLGTRPAEQVDTDSNDEPTADANGDSDDEREDENQAVPDPSHDACLSSAQSAQGAHHLSPPLLESLLQSR